MTEINWLYNAATPVGRDPNPLLAKMLTDNKPGVDLFHTNLDKQLNAEESLDVTERKLLEEGVWFHPLKQEFAQALPPLQDPTPATGTELCFKDCKERERIRKKECAEVRKRVSQKLKDMVCPSTVSAIAQNFGCGAGGKAKGGTAAKTRTTKTVTVKSAPKKSKFKKN